MRVHLQVGDWNDHNPQESNLDTSSVERESSFDCTHRFLLRTNPNGVEEMKHVAQTNNYPTKNNLADSNPVVEGAEERDRTRLDRRVEECMVVGGNHTRGTTRCCSRPEEENQIADLVKDGMLMTQSPSSSRMFWVWRVELSPENTGLA